MMRTLWSSTRWILLAAVGGVVAGALACSGTSIDPLGGTLDASTDGAVSPAEDGGLTAEAGKPDSGGDAGPAATYSVGGSATGLVGTGLVLQDNGGDDLPIGANGSFTFATKLQAGTAYAVTIKTQPTAPSQMCTVSGGTGTMGTGNVTSVTVNCASNKFTVGGTASGLAGTGLVLQNNAGDDLVLSANGSFSFATTLLDAATYAVTVKTQPGSPSQTCAVTNGSGTIAAANVTNVTVTCATNKYTVGGVASGIVGSGLVLQNNAGDNLAVATSGTFTFATSITSGASYAVTVKTQPTSPAQTCSVSGGTGTVGAANITSVTVNCTTNTYTIGGTASGIVGSGLVLQNNAGDDLIVSANGTFAFATPLASGAPYAVTVKTQPSSPTQTCVLTAATGTVASANIANVGLSCTTNKYKVGGTVSGLAGTGLILQDNGGDDLAVSVNGSFQFATSVSSGATYTVTVKTQPTALSQSCIVTNGISTIGGADITNVAVSCATNTYTVGGTVSGLSGTGLVLKDNGGDNLTVPGNGAFTFATKVSSGGAYAVTIGTQPTSPTQTCMVSAATGTVTNGNVTTVAVNCTTNTYTVGGTASGLLGTGLVLQNNAGDDLTVNNDGTFAFGTPIASGAPYSVTVKTSPTNPGQTCVVGNASGTVGGANVSNVTVTCACPGGRCLVTLASGQNGAYGIAVDATSVYWTTPVTGTVMKVPLGGGAPTTLASGQNGPEGIAVDATSVYWVNGGSGGSGGAVMKVLLGGGAPTTLVSGQSGPYTIAVDAASVYWTNIIDNTVMKVPLGGGAPTTLASGQASPEGMAVDATSVYWVNGAASAPVMKVPIGGGAPTTLASGSGASPRGIAVDATSVYWTAPGAGTVMKVPLGGGASTTLATGQQGYGIAVDATSVYWTATNLSAVMKVPIGGGAATTLATGQLNPKCIAVDATSVYWTNYNSGTVMKLTPK